MKRFLFTVFTILVFISVQFAQTKPSAPDFAELTKLLNEFLAGASRNDYAMHDKFWAEDLIYTRAAGVRTTKAEIMKGRNAPPPKPDAPKAVFTAEDVRVQQYGKAAVIAYRLVATVIDQGETRVSKYYATATMLKRNGKWQAASYQVTPVQRSEEEAKKEVAAAETAFWRAVLASDAKTLKRLTDDSFIWVHHTGEQNTAKQFLDDITSGTLKYSKLETDKVTVSVTGDTAIVRGTSARQRADSTPFTTFYTLTFVNRGGAWKAVSLHTSRNCE